MEKKLKKYRVKLEFRVRDTIEVEAENEEEAESLALQQMSMVNAEYYDGSVEEI